MNSTPQANILLVEDDPSLARLLGTNLKDHGFAVHAEHLGAGAISYAEAHQPDLVILDITLPDMEGYQVAYCLRNQYGPDGVPILMLTAKASPQDQMDGFEHGADAYLTKPCSTDELLQSIDLLLGRVAPN